MRKCQFIGVQTQPLEFPAAALGVADDWVADEFAVDAELVCAPRYGFELDQGCVGVSLTHPKP